MAKTSSSKKVARVARTGAGKRRVRERPKLGFPITIFLILVAGSLTVFYARSERVNMASAAEPPVANQDHWHVAYGVYVCDHFLPPATDKDPSSDPNGIHTHGDGIIHAHPFNAASAGANARLKVWGDQVGFTFGDGSITTPDGTVFDSNYKCDDKPAKVYVYRWPSALDPQSTADVFTDNLGQVRLKDDRSAITFAVVPEGTDPSSVPRPDSINGLNNLTDVPGGGAGADAGGIEGLPPGVSLPPDISVPGQSPAVPTESVPGAPAVSTPAAPASTP